VIRLAAILTTRVHGREPRPAPIDTLWHVEVLPAAREVLVGGTRASLGARAFDVLVALIERSDRVVSKHELLDLVWPGIAVEESNLPVHISALRKLIGPEVICTVPGRGYRFTAALDGEATSTSTSESAAASGAQSPTGLRTNLPAEIPPLYGRDEDLLALRSLIEAHRLVTLTGAGGIGKSVLAQALATNWGQRLGMGPGSLSLHRLSMCLWFLLRLHGF